MLYCACITIIIDYEYYCFFTRDGCSLKCSVYFYLYFFLLFEATSCQLLCSFNCIAAHLYNVLFFFFFLYATYSVEYWSSSTHYNSWYHEYFFYYSGSSSKRDGFTLRNYVILKKSSLQTGGRERAVFWYTVWKFNVSSMFGLTSFIMLIEVMLIDRRTSF